VGRDTAQRWGVIETAQLELLTERGLAVELGCREGWRLTPADAGEDAVRLA